MRQLLLTAGFVVLAVGCGKQVAPGYSSSAGSLALSADQKYLYAVDTDNNLVGVIDTAKNAKIAEIQVGTAPERVVVGPDDAIYVSNRGDRSVSILERGTWQEKARLPVGVEPMGLAVSKDGKTLYVVNSTALDTPAQGSLMAIDVPSQKLLWETKVGEEPRGIALVDSHTAAITLYKQGDVVFVDLNSPATGQQAIGGKIYAGVNATKLSGGSSSGFGTAFSSFKTRSMADITVSPDGNRLYATALFEREDPIALPPSVSVPYYQSGGPCNIGGVATAGIVTVDAKSMTPKVDDLTKCAFSGASSTEDFPPSTLGSPSATAQPIQGAHVSAVDPTNSWIFIVNRESNSVAIVSTSSRDGAGSSFGTTGSAVRAWIHVGRAPNGIALTSDGTKAYVYNSFDHTVSVLMQDTSQSTPIVVEHPELRVTVASDPAGMSAEALKGRALFFDATDTQMSSESVRVSCNTCHVEGGREDGHTWGFPDGPRQTPSLAGRMMAQTAPYHWTGEFPDMNAFLDHTVQTRMGGTGLDAVGHSELAAYIATLKLPDNPLQLATPTDQQVRGAQVFASAQCSTCHAGQTLTNNGFATVDDPSKLQGSDQIPTQGLNVPSLLGVGRTAPYLHDGSAATLADRINADRLSPGAQNLHGNLQNVTDQQVADLVAYLQAL